MPLARFLAFHAFIGFSITTLFAAILFSFDIAGLNTLFLNAQIGWIAAASLIAMLCLTCISIQMGIAALGSKTKQKSSYRFAFNTESSEANMVLQPVRIRK